MLTVSESLSSVPHVGLLLQMHQHVSSIIMLQLVKVEKI